MRAVHTWAAAGAAFGAAFPAIAVGLRAATGGVEGTTLSVSGDPLMWIIFTAPLFLGAFAALGGRQQDRVRALARGLEVRVAERTADLGAANAALSRLAASQQALLAGLDAGFAVFGPDGRLSEARSAALGRLLPGSEEHHSIDELLSDYTGLLPATTAQVRELLWDPSFFSPVEETLAMISGRFTVEERLLEISFFPVSGEDGALSGVLLQVLDRSAEARAEREREQAGHRLERLSTAAGAPEAFHRFCDELSRLFDRVAAGDEGQARALHTLKGTARTMGFHEVAAIAHQAEDDLAQGLSIDVEDGRELFLAQAREVRGLLGLDRHIGRVEVEVQALDALAQRLAPADAEALRALARRPLDQALGHQLRGAADLAERLGVPLILRVEGSPLDAGEVGALETALVHCLTNAVTHAGEGHRQLSICVRVDRARGGVHLQISDDGPGVDAELLAHKAVQRGIWTPARRADASRAEKLELVFAAGLSTRDVASSVAGRGEGLAAVREQVGALSGQVWVESEPGRGATFHVRLPATAGRVAA